MNEMCYADVTSTHFEALHIIISVVASGWETNPKHREGLFNKLVQFIFSSLPPNVTALHSELTNNHCNHCTTIEISEYHLYLWFSLGFLFENDQLNL